MSAREQAVELLREALERSHRRRCALELELDSHPALAAGLRLGVAIAHEYQRELDELELERALEDEHGMAAFALARRMERECGVSFACDDPDQCSDVELERAYRERSDVELERVYRELEP